jgi:hypothetical protein
MTSVHDKYRDRDKFTSYGEYAAAVFLKIVAVVKKHINGTLFQGQMGKFNRTPNYGYFSQSGYDSSSSSKSYYSNIGTPQSSQLLQQNEENLTNNSVTQYFH